MTLSTATLVRSTVLAILVGLLALLAIVGTSIWLVGRTQAYSDRLIAARQERAALVDLRSLLQDAETGQRGYLLTGEAAYLAPYDDARAKVASELATVEKIVQSDARQASLMADLRPLITGKLSELNETVELMKAGRREDAVATVRSDRGRKLMDDARIALAAMVANAEARVSAAVDDQRSSIVALRWVSILGALVIIASAGAVIAMITAYTRQLIAAQREIQILNAGLEERVAERTADLARANEEIQRFAYIVTHDLRAPLVNIMGFTSELETSLEPIRQLVEQQSEAGLAVPDEARAAAVEDLPEAIGFIRSSTRKMDGLINAILKLSREGRRVLKPERVELDALLRTAAESIQHQVAEAGGSVSIEGRVPAIRSDRLSLEQIFGNLLDNAVKYRAPDRQPQIRLVATEERGRLVSVRVEDNGRGIAAQDHDRVFDLFRRSGSQDQPGEGIGLAHVRAMVRNLGGDITLRSELGRGTVFTVTLPRDIKTTMGTA
jgi:signal transduction histidine kinase